MQTCVLVVLCWVAASVSLDVATLSPDEVMEEYRQTEDNLTTDRDKDQAAVSADAEKLRQTEKALRETKSEQRTDKLQQRRAADSVKRLGAHTEDMQGHLDELKATAKRLKAIAKRKEKLADAASVKQDGRKKKLTAVSKQLKAQDEVVERTMAALHHKHSNVDEARESVKQSRAKVRELRTSMGLATDHLDAAAKTMADAEAGDKQARLDLNKRAEQLKKDRLAEAKMESALRKAEMQATENQQSIDQAMLVQRAEARSLQDRMKSASEADKAAAAQGKAAEASRRIAQTLEESLGLADGEELTVGQLGEHIVRETDKILQLKENVTALSRDARISRREQAMVDKEGLSAEEHEKALSETVKQEETTLEGTQTQIQKLTQALTEARPTAENAARVATTAQQRLKHAEDKQDALTAKRKKAERKIHSEVQANIPPGVSITKAQQMLRDAQRRVKKARRILHTAIETEHDSMDATKKAQAVLKRDKKHSTKLIQKVNSMKQQLRSSEQRLLRLQGKIDGDTSGEGELHNEASLMHKRVKKIGQEAASVASKLQQTKEDLKTAQHRLAQMQTKQKQLSAKIQAELKQAEPSKMFGPSAQVAQKLHSALAPEEQEKMQNMINQAAEASAANDKVHETAAQSAADEIAEEQQKIKSPEDLKKFKAKLKREQEESKAKRDAQEEERKEQAALAAADSKEQLELMKAKQAALEADAQAQASDAANAAKKAARSERENTDAEVEMANP